MTPGVLLWLHQVPSFNPVQLSACCANDNMQYIHCVLSKSHTVYSAPSMDVTKSEPRSQSLKEIFNEWENRKVCTRRELESFIGILQHACKVIWPGRSFIRRAIALLSITKQPHHHNTEFRSDLYKMVEGIRGPLEWGSCHGDT